MRALAESGVALGPLRAYSQRVPGEGLNAEKLGVLRRWGTGLQSDPRDEVAAAGRAITLLIEEIERLHVLVWDRRLYPEATPEMPSPPAEAAPAEEVEPQSKRRSLTGALRGRVRRAAPEASPQPELSPGADFLRPADRDAGDEPGDLSSSPSGL